MAAVGVDLAAAEQFVLREARLLDRRRFAFLHRGGSADAVVAALVAHRNGDGGFGNALESDIRGNASQTVPVERAFELLDEVDRFDAELVASACDWLSSVTTDAGGVPFVLPTVVDGPHAPWWEPANVEANLNPTAGIAGVLHKRGIDHAWLDSATEFCWTDLEQGVDGLGPDDAISVLTFLEHVHDRERAAAVFDALGERILGDLVALDPNAEGYVKTPLDFAPRPDSPARGLFDDTTIDTHLDALATKQQDDGGWPITWEPPGAAAVSEWRGVVTLKALAVLDAYAAFTR